MMPAVLATAGDASQSSDNVVIAKAVIRWNELPRIPCK
jgi:hypothetical protein